MKRKICSRCFKPEANSSDGGTAEGAGLCFKPCEVDPSTAYDNIMAVFAQRDKLEEKLKAAMKGLRTIAKVGTGPCGGGGLLDVFNQGKQQAQSAIRKIAKSIIKEVKDK